MGVDFISVMDVEDDDMKVHMLVSLVGPGIFYTCWNDQSNTIMGSRMGFLELNIPLSIILLVEYDDYYARILEKW